MKTCSILLVNDDPQVIATLHEALSGVRHRLVVGPTANAALASLTEQRCRFDVLLVALAGELAGLVSGCRFFAVRRHVAPDAPSVLLTAGMHGDEPAGVEATFH